MPTKQFFVDNFHRKAPAILNTSPIQIIIEFNKKKILIQSSLLRIWHFGKSSDYHFPPSWSDEVRNFVNSTYSLAQKYFAIRSLFKICLVSILVSEIYQLKMDWRESLDVSILGMKTVFLTVLRHHRCTILSSLSPLSSSALIKIMFCVYTSWRYCIRGSYRQGTLF